MAQKDLQRGVFIAEEPHMAEGAEAPAERNPTPKTRREEDAIAKVRFWQERGELWRLIR